MKHLGASFFFFSRGGGDVGIAGKFFTIIAVQSRYIDIWLRSSYTIINLYREIHLCLYFHIGKRAIVVYIVLYMFYIY
jgi:hypothetical protein